MRARIQKISRYAPSIFQGRIEFGGKRAAGFSFTVEHHFERVLWRTMTVATLLLVGLYMYFVCVSILNVIATKDANVESGRLANAVAALERDYFALAEAVDPAIALRLGLAPIKNTVYVHRPGNLSAGVPAMGEAAANVGNEI